MPTIDEQVATPTEGTTKVSPRILDHMGGCIQQFAEIAANSYDVDAKEVRITIHRKVLPQPPSTDGAPKRLKVNREQRNRVQFPSLIL